MIENVLNLTNNVYNFTTMILMSLVPLMLWLDKFLFTFSLNENAFGAFIEVTIYYVFLWTVFSLWSASAQKVE